MDINLELMTRLALSGDKDAARAIDAAHAQVVKRETLAAARGGFDNSDLTERGVRGIFFDALEIAAGTNWARMVSLMIQSDAELERHRWLGQVPQMREHLGALLARGLNNFGIDIENKDFESSIGVSRHDSRRDKTGQLIIKIGDLARRAESHWKKLVVDLLQANPLGYDGVSLYNVAHLVGDAAAQDNALVAGTLPSLNISDTSRITKTEAALVLAQMAAKFFEYKDDKDEPANEEAMNFLVLTPPSHWPGFQAAIRDQLVPTGGTNDLSNLGWNFTAVPEPRLTSAPTIVYMFRTDAQRAGAVILQEEEEPRVEVIADGSEHAIKTNEFLYTAKATRNVGPGQWRHTIRGTFS